MVVKESACCPVTTEMVCSPTSSSLNCISRRKWCSVFADHERASGKFTAGESTLLLCVQLSSLMQLKSEHLSLERFRSSIFSTFSFDQTKSSPPSRSGNEPLTSCSLLEGLCSFFKIPLMVIYCFHVRQHARSAHVFSFSSL